MAFVLEQSPIVVGASLEDFRVQVEIEGVLGDQARLTHGPELHRIEKDAAIGGGPHENRNRHSLASGQQAGTRAQARFLLGVAGAQEMTHLGARHLALEFGRQQALGQESILAKENVFIEADVRHADRALVS